MTHTRENALELLKRHNKDDGHVKHALAVEASMVFFAEKMGGDVEKWGMAGLLHDIDWEEMQETPERHTIEGARWLAEEGYPEDIVRAVLAHGWGLCSEVKPESDMEKVLFTVDELTGLVMTAALVRPSRSVQDLEVKSVKKKWKDKAFAKGVNRELIVQGAEMIPMPLDTVIEWVILAMRRIEPELGLGIPANA
jgi:putative nucleotidyltransferase with HDIG domain